MIADPTSSNREAYDCCNPELNSIDCDANRASALPDLILGGTIPLLTSEIPINTCINCSNCLMKLNTSGAVIVKLIGSGLAIPASYSIRFNPPDN